MDSVAGIMKVEAFAISQLWKYGRRLCEKSRRSGLINGGTKAVYVREANERKIYL